MGTSEIYDAPGLSRDGPLSRAVLFAGDIKMQPHRLRAAVRVAQHFSCRRWNAAGRAVAADPGLHGDGPHAGDGRQPAAGRRARREEPPHRPPGDSQRRLSRRFFLARRSLCRRPSSSRPPGSGFSTATLGRWSCPCRCWRSSAPTPAQAFHAAMPLLSRRRPGPGPAVRLARDRRARSLLRRFWMSAAVICWTAGFDIIYACQDYEMRRRLRRLLRSVAAGHRPAHCGLPDSRTLSASPCWSLWGFRRRASAASTLPVWAVAAILLIVEHRLVRANDLSKVGLAFFTINGIISLLVGDPGDDRCADVGAMSEDVFGSRPLAAQPRTADGRTTNPLTQVEPWSIARPRRPSARPPAGEAQPA